MKYRSHAGLLKLARLCRHASARPALLPERQGGNEQHREPGFAHRPALAMGRIQAGANAVLLGFTARGRRITLSRRGLTDVDARITADLHRWLGEGS